MAYKISGTLNKNASDFGDLTVARNSVIATSNA